ncbi:MAG TPA: hypothetical protein VJS38_07490 [Phenylobacterium sp.]|uniref:hypothetical protein n=1 Tax=Phenylobacterium sp. TaxID=1871053 RepID=UPI002B48D419|nr:hypothetical protein [Phenylobacterium sp.]HKR88003.1 hypothetical protein [Phenylobacterium sp.]
MKKLVLAALAAAAMAAVAAPALAHEGDDDDWSIESYDAFTQQYHHIWDGIQHGVSDGSYSPRQAQYFYRQLRGIQARRLGAAHRPVRSGRDQRPAAGPA